MKCLVIYESMFGNTHRIATAIGDGLVQVGEVEVCALADAGADRLVDVDLLVVGGPTHVHGMTRESSREVAVEDAEQHADVTLDDDAPGPGLREWLGQLEVGPGVYGAAFDTRIDKPVILVGAAARGISKRLKRSGCIEIVDPESFFVASSLGPLCEGETDRARKWGANVAHELTRIWRYREALG